ncbi:hypothetical protein RJT34_07176 [Clitoria ternatea]|uniref:Uncharacterized protein n=1 Tax=Clitoria ternatea TaxID=43366 RepID=A0AAN9PTE5_CLITE
MFTPSMDSGRDASGVAGTVLIPMRYVCVSKWFFNTECAASALANLAVDDKCSTKVALVGGVNLQLVTNLLTDHQAQRQHNVELGKMHEEFSIRKEWAR